MAKIVLKSIFFDSIPEYERSEDRLMLKPRIDSTGKSWRMLLMAVIAVAGIFSVAQAEEEHDHAAMMAGMAKAPMDELGRRLHGHKHVIEGEVGDQLRSRIVTLKDVSNAQLTMMMQMMGANYEWYISSPDLKADVGVLILAHGFRDRGDKVFKETVQAVGGAFPTAIAFGMSMAMSQHIQLAVDDLVAAGAKEIVVVPAVSSSINDMMRQWQYIFGLRETAEYGDVPQVVTDAEVHFLSAPDDDPLIAEILLDYADDMSTDPSNTLAVIVAHGPTMDEDNVHELKTLGNLAALIKEDGGYSDVIGITLQDDAAPEVRAANVANLRKKIEAATAKGKEVVIVTTLLSTRGIQAKLRKDLKGLDYKFARESLTQHDNFIVWVMSSIDDQLMGR